MSTDMRSTVNVAEAAAMLGINKLTAYDSIRRGDFPVPTIKIGRRIVVPKAALDKVLEEGANHAPR